MWVSAYLLFHLLNARLRFWHRGYCIDFILRKQRFFTQPRSVNCFRSWLLSQFYPIYISTSSSIFRYIPWKMYYCLWPVVTLYTLCNPWYPRSNVTQLRVEKIFLRQMLKSCGDLRLDRGHEKQRRSIEARLKFDPKWRADRCRVLRQTHTDLASAQRRRRRHRFHSQALPRKSKSILKLRRSYL